MKQPLIFYKAQIFLLKYRIIWYDYVVAYFKNSMQRAMPLKELICLAGKNKVQIRIGGKDYTLVGIEAEEYIQKVGLYIDKKINEITRSNSLLSTSMASILAAVNVADDFFKSHENEKRLEDELARACEELEKLRRENESLLESNSNLISRNTLLQLELAKREAELSEVRASLERTSRKKEPGYEEG